jgi:uncharacterized membrane protein
VHWTGAAVGRLVGQGKDRGKRWNAAGTRALFIVSGLVSVAFGVVLFARPGVGAVTLALLFGLFTIIYGISQITLGIETRRTGKTLHGVLPDAA